MLVSVNSQYRNCETKPSCSGQSSPILPNLKPNFSKVQQVLSDLSRFRPRKCWTSIDKDKAGQLTIRCYVSIPSANQTNMIIGLVLSCPSWPPEIQTWNHGRIFGGVDVHALSESLGLVVCMCNMIMALCLQTLEMCHWKDQQCANQVHCKDKRVYKACL